MISPFFSVEYDDSAISDRLKQLLKKTGNVAPALEEIGQYVKAITDTNFENETDPYGNPWPKNSPSVLAYKKSQGFIAKVLQQRGFLRNSINYQVKGNTVLVGTNVAYAYEHQLGINQIQRQFLGVSEQDAEEIKSIIQEYLEAPE